MERPDVGDFIAIATTRAHQEFSSRLDEEKRKAAPGLKTFRFDVLPVAIPAILRSDNRAFLLHGHPAIMLTDTADFRNPDYHSPRDTVETIDRERFTLVVRGLAGAAYAIAGPGEPRP